MDSLIDEIVLLMTTFLDDKSLIMWALCGKKWESLLSDTLLWKNRIISIYGSSLSIPKKDQLHPRKYYGWLVSNQMIRLKDHSKRFNQSYKQLLDHYLTLEKSLTCNDSTQIFNDSTQFFNDLINSTRTDIQINKKDLLLHLTILSISHFEKIELSPVIQYMTQKEKGSEWIEWVKTQTKNTEICLLVALSSLTFDELHSYTFTE